MAETACQKCLSRIETTAITLPGCMTLIYQ